MKAIYLLLLLVGFSYSQIETLLSVPDTSSLKTMSVGLGGAMFLRGYSSSTNNGAGIYIVVDSAYAEGTQAFDHPTRGYQWYLMSNQTLNDSSVAGSKIQSATINTSNLANSSVTTTKIADSSITSAKIATGSIGYSNLSQPVKDSVNQTIAIDTSLISRVQKGSIQITGTNNLQLYDGANWQEVATYPLYGRSDEKHGNKNIHWNQRLWRHVGIRIVDTTYATWSDTLLGFGFDVVWDYNTRKYVMVAAAADTNLKMRVGIWTGDNPVKWTEYGSNPVFDVGADGQWDDEGITFPQLHYENNKWYMFYAGFANEGLEQGKSSIGVAYADSLQGPWTRYSGNPVVNSTDITWVVAVAAGAWTQIYKPELIKHKGRYYLFYNAGKYGTEYIGYSYADSITGPYSQGDTVITQRMTGYAQNADPDIHLVGDKYFCYFWGPSPKIYVCDYDDFPGTTDDWTPYETSPQFYPSGQVRPVIVMDDSRVYCYTWDTNRRSINVYAPADQTDVMPQVLKGFTRTPRYDETDGNYLHILRTNSGSWQGQGTNMRINGDLLRGRSCTLTGRAAFSYIKSSGSGHYRLRDITKGITIQEGTFTASDNFESVLFDEYFESNYFNQNHFLSLQIYTDTAADTMYIQYYDFDLTVGGW